MRIYAYIAAAILLAGVVGYGIHIVKKANRAEAAEQALAKAQDEFKADVERLSKAAAINSQIAADLSLYRNEQAAVSQTFRDELAKRGITREIRYITKDGTETVCTQRDPARYRELFNQAVDPVTSP